MGHAMKDQRASPDDYFKARSDAEPHSKNLLSYSEMVQLRPPVWRIDNVLPEGASAVLFGESNSFKSFLAIDLACSIALGIPWHGQNVTPGHALYVASESAHGIATKRVPAWMARHEIHPDQRRGIFLRSAPPLLDDPDSLKIFITDILSVHPLAAIFYDVLAGTMKGSEKDTDVIAAWVRIVAEIAAQFEVTQLFVTHSPYSDSGRIRGGTHLWGSFDTRLKADGDREKRTTVLSVERHKDHDSVGLRWGFKLEITNIDEFPGQTSLVPVREDEPARSRNTRLSDTAEEALRAFKYALTEGAGQKVGNPHVPAGVDVLPVALWRLYFDKLTTFQGSADAQRKRFDRGIKRLVDIHLVAKWDDHWWLTDAGRAVPS
jgi:hypothetical protein